MTSLSLTAAEIEQELLKLDADITRARTLVEVLGEAVCPDLIERLREKALQLEALTEMLRSRPTKH